jgi:site-specific DNA recombinase
MNQHALQTTTKTKAVIYARISSVAQLKKGHGLESQTTRCREFARLKGYEVVEVFQDGAVSGGTLNRPGIQIMLAYLREHRGAGNYIVLIDDISRMARDIRAHLDLRDAIKDAGAGLESPSIEFGEDSDSILVENLLASVSQHQRQKGAEQTKNRMRARLQNGYWPFTPPIGYKTQTIRGRGKVLMRDEPLASVITEALESYASGRFQLQAEVARWLQNQPDFPKNRFGNVTDEAANRVLTRLLYSGMVERPEWGISLREGQHEGLISFETFQKIQTRLSEKPQAPVRVDISNDFILRGSVVCADCSHPMTASWAKSKTGKQHPYYSCFKKGCDSYRKSIRRDKMEDEFAKLLTTMQPTQRIITFARGMFANIWKQLQTQCAAHKNKLQHDIKMLETQIENLLDRIVDAENSSVVGAYEKRIAALDRKRLVMAEKLTDSGQSFKPFDELFQLAMQFVSSPATLWDTGRIEHRQTVLKLAFQDRLHYCRKSGFRTPAIAYPFRLLGQLGMGESLMADREGFEPSERVNAHTLSKRAP